MLPNFQNAIEWTMPFLGSCVNHAFKYLLALDNGKMTKRLKEILNSRSKFEEELRLV